MSEALGFFSFFGRPDHVITDLYHDQLGASIGGNELATKYQNLFSDAFGHHIQIAFETPPAIQVQAQDYRRVVTADSLTAYFLDNLYRVPTLYESPNGTHSAADIISYDLFLRSISGTAVTRTTGTSDTIGSNRFSFIIGDIGTGKTLLVSKIIRDILTQQRDAPEQDYLTVPIYFDFENEMRSDSGQLLPIRDEFFDRLGRSLLRTAQGSSLFKHRAEPLTTLWNDHYGTHEAKFVTLVQTAHRVGLRPLLILDNIDGYHYYYSKYTFFERYRQQQIDSVQANISYLSSILTSGHRLGLLGMAVVIVARRYVYTECIHTVKPETPLEAPGSVFQLEPANEVEIVASRMDLFSEAIQKIESDPRLRTFGEDYKRSLERIRTLLGLRQKATALRDRDEDSTEARKVLTLIRRLCHHGNRGMVTFLSNLRLDYRDRSSLMERFLWYKPYTLALLYISDLRKRYSQLQGHFPNMFLVDGLIQKRPEFADAHKPHVHTYWLKYLILAYVNAQEGQTATERELRRLFVTVGDFDDTLFRLALGSLATSREFGCLDPEPGEYSIPGRVQITDRGATLVSEWRDRGVPFCLTFTYLQLIVDDPLMSYPLSMLSKIYISQIDLGYLFADEATYINRNSEYLELKMKSVLALLRVLETAYGCEEELRPRLFSQLKERSPSVLLNFNSIVESLFDQFRRISRTFSDTTKASMLMTDLRRYWRDICASPEPENEIRSYLASELPIEE